MRLDTTLLNVTEKSLKRGERSYLITLAEDSAQVEMTTLDRESRTFAKEILFELPSDDVDAEELRQQFDEECNMHLVHELVDVDLTTSSMTFTEALSGWIGFRKPRVETVCERECRVRHYH